MQTDIFANNYREIVAEHIFWYHSGVGSLEQAVQGSWFDLREQIRHPNELFESLFPGTEGNSAQALLIDLARELDQAVEGGVLEVKKHRFTTLFVELEEAEFSSEIFSHLKELARRARVLAMAIALQRALLSQEIPFMDDEEKPDEPEEPGEIRQIIQDIQEIIAADPSAKMNAAIKNILLQLQKYRTETATYQKLKEQATGYRLEMYSKTFAATFQNIFTSIRRNYDQFRKEQDEMRRQEQRSVIASLETREWTRALMRQMEEANRIAATLTFLAGEHSGMREPLVELSRRRAMMMKLLETDRIQGEDCAGGEAAARRLNRILAIEVAKQLHRLCGC